MIYSIVTVRFLCCLFNFSQSRRGDADELIYRSLEVVYTTPGLGTSRYDSRFGIRETIVNIAMLSGLYS